VNKKKKSSFLIMEYRKFVSTIVRIVQHLRDHGSYKSQIQNRRVANVEEGILSSVEDQPGTSSTRLARQHNILFSEY
jgi:hypothetical protein